MELWELVAREEIRDLVARYNANGDTGRFAQVLELFAPDAVMVIDGGRVHDGVEDISTIFTNTKAMTSDRDVPMYVRHNTSTHQIDLVDETTATGRCYFQVLTSVGLDHWGRYVDAYRVVEGHWRFARRAVTVDGYSPGALFSPTWRVDDEP
jgi:ketosteroid isomerase-like protein